MLLVIVTGWPGARWKDGVDVWFDGVSVDVDCWVMDESPCWEVADGVNNGEGPAARRTWASAMFIWVGYRSMSWLSDMGTCCWNGRPWLVGISPTQKLVSMPSSAGGGGPLMAEMEGSKKVDSWLRNGCG